MAAEITVPRLGWSMEEAVFSAWLKNDGERVRAGDPLFAIESDKATQEIESMDAGVLRIPPDAPKPGETVIVGQRIGYLLAPGESAPGPDPPSAGPAHPPPPDHPAPGSVPAVKQPPVAELGAVTPVSTPRARRLASQLGLDWSRVAGSGRGGRIREADIRNAAVPSSPSALSSTRRVIAERMVASRRMTAPVTLHTTADASALVRLRDDFKRADSSPGAIIPGYTDMLVTLVAAALRAHPVLNSRWDGDTLVTSTDIHIGIAVDTKAGLLAPVLRDAATLSLGEVAIRSRDLADRARGGRLRGDELRGGTFTISSLGAFGIDGFTPIINHPECAILGVGRILRQPVAAGDSVALRDIISLSLTFDHRAFDGAPAARFLQTLSQLIESPPAVLQ